MHVIEKDVHTEHCCLKHGCKYANKNCTVVTKEKSQSYWCYDCDEEMEEGYPVDRDGHMWDRLYIDDYEEGDHGFYCRNCDYEIAVAEDAEYIGFPKCSDVLMDKACK